MYWSSFGSLKKRWSQCRCNLYRFRLFTILRLSLCHIFDCELDIALENYYYAMMRLWWKLSFIVIHVKHIMSYILERSILNMPFENYTMHFQNQFERYFQNQSGKVTLDLTFKINSWHYEVNWKKLNLFKNWLPLRVSYTNIFRLCQKALSENSLLAQCSYLYHFSSHSSHTNNQSVMLDKIFFMRLSLWYDFHN